ncbi:MAG: oligoendopeptidase F, partial [Pseudomonadota bacterium]
MPHDTAERAGAATRLGPLPEWQLGDLYPGPQSQELADALAQLEADCKAFEAAWKGVLADRLAADNGGAALADALSQYERLEDTMGRIGSYAGLLYATDTTNALYAKTYGDISDTLTRFASHLLFFPLALNKIDDGVMERALAHEGGGHYRPFIEDLRKERPYQLSDEIERLFLDKTASSRVGWTRLFDETIAGMRVTLGDGDDPVTLEEALNKLLDPEEAVRKTAAEGIGAALKSSER